MEAIQLAVETECPVCHGTGRMSVVKIIGTEKRSVNVRCTACGGVGFVPFVNHSKTVSEEAKVEPIEDIAEVKGWRRYKDWEKVHYFIEGKSLCGNIRSRRSIMRSIAVENPSLNDECVICLRRYRELVE